MIIFAIGIFILISIMTFSPNDPPFANYPVNNPVQNYCGKLGAGVSGYLITCIGITSYVFAFLIGALGVALFLKKRIEILWVRILGGILLIFSVAPILGILDNFANFTLPLETGGIIGMIASFRLAEYLGIPGACILLATGFFISITLISNKSLDSSFGWAYRKIKEKFIPRSLLTDNTQSIFEMDPEKDATVKERTALEEEKSEGTVTVVPKSYVEQKPRKRDSAVKAGKHVLPKGKGYVLPLVSLLDELTRHKFDSDEHIMEKASTLKETLAQFKVVAEVVGMEKGPSVTMYELELAPGTKVGKISNLHDDIAIALKAQSVRVVAPIQGKSTIGIEVPNQKKAIVSMKSLISSKKFTEAEMELPIAIGKTISNETFVVDLTKMPHLLMAGATGQGKSVGINAILCSILYKKHPAEVKFVLVDPKKIELSIYNKIEKHYLAKLPDSDNAIIINSDKVINTLNSLCREMDKRYELLKNAMTRNIKEYNSKFVSKTLNPEKDHMYLPYIVLVIDEFADLIMTSGKEIETPLARLAQLSRAVGIHLIIATQRPSVNVITGLIKANFPARIAYRVTSKIDSRTILDTGGAEQLIGRGDLLYSQSNTLTRIQCGFIDSPDVEKISEFIGSQIGYPNAYELPEFIKEEKSNSESISGERDPMFNEAARVIVSHQQGSASLLQRKLKLGYNRAGRIIDQMEEAGIVGPFEGSKARQVLISDLNSLENILGD